MSRLHGRVYFPDGSFAFDIMPPGTEGMTDPVQCNRCGRGIYDLGTVKVTARYVDCSMWKAPCCGALVDDRGETGWKSFSDYTRISGAR